LAATTATVKSDCKNNVMSSANAIAQQSAAACASAAAAAARASLFA